MVWFVTDMHSYEYIAGKIVYNVYKYYSGKSWLPNLIDCWKP